MTPTEAIHKAGSVMALARILGVKRQAVQFYKKSGGLPILRIEQLRAARPEWFKGERR